MDYTSIIEELLQYNFPTDNDEDILPIQNEIKNATHELGDDDSEFIHKKLEVVFQSLNISKAAGVGRLSHEILEIFYRANKPLFHEPMTDSVLFNKLDTACSLASSNRPICLLPAWSKILNKILTNRLVYHVMFQGNLHRNQIGLIQA